MAVSNVSCTRRIEFDAAHRVMQHESKCRHLHGHRYVIEAAFQADAGLDALGRVIDFGIIKQLLGSWVDEFWDHNTILHEADKPLGDVIASQTAQTVYYMTCNPTAENMAAYLLDVVCPTLFTGTGVVCKAIRLHETPNCYADAITK